MTTFVMGGRKGRGKNSTGADDELRMGRNVDPSGNHLITGGDPNLMQNNGPGHTDGEQVAKVGDYRPKDLTIRDRVWLTLDDPTYSFPAKFISVSILGLILLSCTAFVVETIPALCCGRHDFVWDCIEYVCVGAFTVEYVGRFLVCPTWAFTDQKKLQSGEVIQGFKTELLSRFHFILKPLNLIDFAAISPFYITLGAEGGGGSATAFLRVIRLARVFRLFKLSKYNQDINLLSTTMKRSWRALGMLGFFMLIAVVVFSSIMYFVERGQYFYCTHEGFVLGLCNEEDVVESRTEGQGLETCATWMAQNYASSQDVLKCCFGEAWYVPHDMNGDGCADKSQYDSILRTAWWCVVTMTTVGYGDVVPLTTEGKVVATCTMLGGILILALPITVIGSNFNIEYINRELEKEKEKELQALEGDGDGDGQPVASGPENGSAQSLTEEAAQRTISFKRAPSDQSRGVSRHESHHRHESHKQQSELLLAIEKMMEDQREAVLKRAEEMMAVHISEIAREVVAKSLARQQNGGNVWSSPRAHSPDDDIRGL